MLYGMKIANLAFVTKTRVRFFKLDRWADVQLPEKRRIKPGSNISKQQRSLLARIFHDRCVSLCPGRGQGGHENGISGLKNSGFPWARVNPTPSREEERQGINPWQKWFPNTSDTLSSS